VTCGGHYKLWKLKLVKKINEHTYIVHSSSLISEFTEWLAK